VSLAEIQRRVRITGQVQGVGFRASTVSYTERFPVLRGWVANRKDGSVEAVFAGPEADVLRCVAWCRSGPESAQVSRLEVFEEAMDPSLGPFSIHR